MDFIITWVDGNDPEWQKEYFKYKEAENLSTHVARFRDWDNLRYWFRGVEKFAPWVDKVHFVTWGHIPDWLNTENPKLNIVRHQDYIPQEYLPTFNSHVIGNNMHRIKELSEEFVYFNDDVFLINHIPEDHFFKNGLPCDMPALEFITGWYFKTILLRAVHVINLHFSLKNSVKQSPIKWFHPKYGRIAIKNFLFFLAARNRFPGFEHFHLALPIRKSTLKHIWEIEPKIMEESSKHRFRNYYTVNLSLQRYWELATNNFHPVNKRKWGRNFEFRVDKVFDAVEFIINQKMPMVCLNDHPSMKNFEETKSQINNALERILPEKSSFEL
ncbi:MAG: Stealth CR1 domain-containing protein [Moheibacter sp.]